MSTVQYAHFFIENIISILGSVFSCFFPSGSSGVAARAQKQEHKQQQQQKVGDVWSPDCIFTMSVFAVLLFCSLSAHLQFHCGLGIIAIRLYLKST